MSEKKTGSNIIFCEIIHGLIFCIERFKNYLNDRYAAGIYFYLFFVRGNYDFLTASYLKLSSTTVYAVY